MTEAEVKNYYQLLGVERGATKEQIRDAYKELARIYHPDSNFYDEVLESAGISNNETEVFKHITQAYNTLTNEKQRAVYDQTILADLPSWEDEKADEWHESRNYHSAPMQRREEPRHATNAFGNFGVVGYNTQQKSAMEDDELNSVRAVSEMLKVKRGLWWKIKWLFFLDK